MLSGEENVTSQAREEIKCDKLRVTSSTLLTSMISIRIIIILKVILIIFFEPSTCEEFSCFFFKHKRQVD